MAGGVAAGVASAEPPTSMDTAPTIARIPLVFTVHLHRSKALRSPCGVRTNVIPCVSPQQGRELKSRALASLQTDPSEWRPPQRRLDSHRCATRRTRKRTNPHEQRAASKDCSPPASRAGWVVQFRGYACAVHAPTVGNGIEQPCGGGRELGRKTRIVCALVVDGRRASGPSARLRKPTLYQLSYVRMRTAV